MSPTRHSVFGLGSESDLAPPIRAFRAVLFLAQRLRVLMDERLRADGLTTQQAALLTAVSRLGQPSLNQAAAALGTSHQNAAQLVAALERKRLLRVVPDPADGRRRLLAPTVTNDRYWRRRNPADHAAVTGWFAALSEDDVETLAHLLVQVIAGLEARRARRRDAR
jgi:DNA-binding MarR family transcriptional regulator